MEQAVWLVSDKSRSNGFPVAYAGDESTRQTAVTRLHDALALIHSTWPRYLPRMRQYVKRIQVRAIIASGGEWHRESRQVDVDLGSLLGDTSSLFRTATVLVHEFTHARIDAVGIPYSPELKVRIERACLSQEMDFIQALPVSEETETLARLAEGQWNAAASVWDEDAKAARYSRAAVSAGLPEPIANFCMRLRRWRRRRRTAA